jgi:hypothetical protein
MSGGRVYIAEGRNHVIPLVNELEMSNPPLVRFFNGLRAPLNERRSFDGLNDDRLPLVVGGLQILQIQSSAHVIPCQQPVLKHEPWRLYL